MGVYSIEVIRRYYVTDTFTITADNAEDAMRQAENMSGDKDCTGKLQLEDVEMDFETIEAGEGE